MNTLHRKFIFATLIILFFSIILAFILANIVYMSAIKQKIDQENVILAEEIASTLENMHSSPSAFTPYLQSIGELGYQFYVLNMDGEVAFYGHPFNKTDIPPEAIKVLVNKEIYHGMNNYAQQFLMMGHFSNDVRNTVGVPFTINDQSYGLFLRQNNKLLFSDIHIILVCFVITVAVVAISGVIWFVKYLIQPITKLTEATKEVSRENFNYPLQIKRNDEIGLLIKGFNKMQNQLQQNDEVRKTFINNVSHDFQSPLMNIQGYAELIRANELTESERNDYLEIIDHESKRLSNLTKQLLLLTSLDQKNYPMKYTKVNIADQIKQTIRRYQWLLEEKEIDILHKLSSITIMADAELLINVWDNLLTNAIKYNVQRGTITINVSSKDSFLYITVEDTGIGMKKEEVSQIFERFYRVDSARKKGGTGLGLSIAKQIIDLHHGTINVKSQIGQGTTFMISLPLE